MSRLVILGLVLVTVIQVLSWWPRTIDDAYITARCADNLAAGLGSGYNAHVAEEVASAPLQVWLLAGSIRLGADPVTTAKITGMVAAVLLVVLVFIVLREMGMDLMAAAVPAGLLAMYPGLGIYATSGLETIPFALAVTAAAAAPARSVTSRWATPVLILALVGTALLRPEGPAVAVVAGVVVGWQQRAAGGRWRLLMAGGLIAVGLGLRLAEFGTLVANPVLAKPSPLGTAGALGLPPLGAVFASLVAKVQAAPIFWGVFVPAAALLAAWAGRLDHRLTGFRWVLIMGLAFVIYAPGDWMPEQRYFLPYLPAALILMTVGAVDAPRKGRAVLLIVAALGLAANGESLVRWHRAYRNGTVIAALDADRHHRSIGEWLAARAAPGDKVLLYEAGALGFFSKREVIDHEGLATRAVGRLITAGGGYQAVRRGTAMPQMYAVVDTCLAREPDWFLVRSRTSTPLVVGQPVPVGMARDVIQNAFLREIARDMVLVREFPMSRAPDRYLVLRKSAAAK